MYAIEYTALAMDISHWRNKALRIFNEEISTKMYPSTLLHTYGVNGKVSGSIGAIGEMSGGVVAVLHGPIGCGYHYRFSARRRHMPFFDLYTTDLTEKEIIYGGEEKLLNTVRKVWEKHHPNLIMIIPTPVTDILNEDLYTAAKTLRDEGIPAVSIKSELFSHRDKSYASRRLKELSKMKLDGNEKLEIELKGCGFTEALYAIVEQVMEPCEKIPLSVNIETVGWGSEGSLVLREIEELLGKAGVKLNCWIPSSQLEKLKKAPAAQLNIVRRIRWAKRMKQVYGTDYMHLDVGGRYDGFDGLRHFYEDVGEKLGISEKMKEVVDMAEKEALEVTLKEREELSKYNCILVCRGLSSVPYTLKTYKQIYSVGIGTICIRFTDTMRRDQQMDPETEERFMNRIQDAIDIYSPGTEVLMNPSEGEMRACFENADAVIGTNDFTLEGKGAPIVPAVSEMHSLSYGSYVRDVKRFLARIKNAKERNDLLLNRMDFITENYPRHEDNNTASAREMWNRMWLNKNLEKKG